MLSKFRSLDLFTKICLSWLTIVVLAAILGPILPLDNPREADSEAMGTGLFSSGHIFGTDTNGYDVLSNIVNGSRLSLLIAVVSVGIGGVVGAAIGIISAFVRGKFDYFVNLFFNIMLSIPNLVLGLALVAVLATSADPTQPVSSGRRVFVVIISLTIVIIPILGRIARGATLTWINREFITAARSMGMKNRDIVLKHVVPNVLPSIYAIGFLAIGVVIVAEGALSLLGVGITDGVSWGAAISRVSGDFTYAPHSMYMPVTVLALTVIACNQIGDYLRAQLDQREGKI